MPKPIRTLLILLLVLALVGGALLLLSWFVPELKSLAKDLSNQKDLPFWIAGLAAPIVYVYRRFTSGIGKLFASGATQQVQAISTSRDDLRKEVDELLQWRRDTLRQEIQSLHATRAELDSVRKELNQVQSEIDALRKKPISEIVDTITDDELDRPLVGGKGG